MENGIKSAAVTALIESIATGSFKGSKLLLVMPWCIISGHPALYNDIVADDINDLPRDRWHASTTASEIHASTVNAKGSSIILYSVEVRTGNDVYRLDSIVVFLDDVVAVTVFD